MTTHTHNNTNENASQQSPDWDDIPFEDEPDYDTLAREYIQDYLFNGKIGKWPENGFGSIDYNQAIAQYEKFITVKDVPAKEMPAKIKADKRLKHLFEDDPMQGGEEQEKEVKGEAPPLNFALPAVNLDGSLFNWAKTEFLAFAKQLSPESYEPFLEAVFWWTCSAIAMRRIAVDFSEPMYTNLYIALCAKSTVWKKSTALRAAERILKGLSLIHIRHKGSETPEAFIYQASGSTIPNNWDELDKTKQESIKRKLATAGLEGLFVDELGQYLMDTRNTNGPMGLWRRIILEWYGCPEDWDKKTKGGGSETVDKAYLSMIGCMVPDNLKGKDMEAMTKDGNIARIRAITPLDGTVAEVATFEQGYLQTPPELLSAFADWHKRLKIPQVDIVLEEREIEDEKAKDGKRSISSWVKVWTQPLEETTIRLTGEAYQYYHRYRVAIRAHIKEHDVSSTIAANYERLGDDFVKMAAMAATFEGKYFIDLTHLAMAYDFIEEARKGIYRLMYQAGYREDVDLEESREEKDARMEKEIIHEIREYFKSSKKKDFSIPVLQNRKPKLQKITLTGLTDRINALVKAEFLLKETYQHPTNKTKTTKYRLNT